MNQTFELEAGSYLAVLELFFFGILALYLGVKVFVGWRAVRHCRSIPGPVATANAWRVVVKAAVRQLYLKSFVFVATLVLFVLVCLNAFIWFSSIQISTGTFQLGFAFRKTYSLERKDVSAMNIVQESHGRKHLEIITAAGQRFRSVSVTNLKILTDIQNAAQAK